MPRNFFSGELEAAWLILRDQVNAIVGFEELAVVTAKPVKSLYRVFSHAGNPSTDNLAAIFGAVREKLKLRSKCAQWRREALQISGLPEVMNPF